MTTKGKAFRVKGTLIIGVIGDETTVTGFLLTGMGERNRKGEANFLVVEKETSLMIIESAFKKMLERDDIGIIMLSQHVAEMIRNLIVEHDAVIPTILEIPSKDVAYDPEKGSQWSLCRNGWNFRR